MNFEYSENQKLIKKTEPYLASSPKLLQESSYESQDKKQKYVGEEVIQMEGGHKQFTEFPMV